MSRTKQTDAAAGNVADAPGEASETALNATGHGDEVWQQLLAARDPTLRVHIMGIGGAGLAPLAMVLQDFGIHVTGSDPGGSSALSSLQARRIPVISRQSPEFLTSRQAAERPHVVLRSSAVPSDNPELRQALQMGLPCVTRDELLPLLLADRDVLAVAGTHGKSTTTAMLAHILTKLDFEPGFVIGASRPDMVPGRAGTGKLFIIEADEYDGMFLGLRPWGAVVTSLEWDHPDCYPTPDRLHEAFADFLSLIRPGGFAIYNSDCAILREWAATEGAPPRRVSYGLGPGADWNVVPDVETALPSSFRAAAGDGSRAWRGTMQACGDFNQLNATAAWLAAVEAGAEPGPAMRALSGFEPVSRRFEFRGDPAGVQLYDDYAHHPSAVRQTLRVARKRKSDGRLWAVFQPHTYSRTKALLPEFARAFEAADHVIVLPTFASRETPADGKDGRDLHGALRHGAAEYAEDLDAAADRLARRLHPGDSVVVMGAGDCVRLTDSLLERLAAGDRAPGVQV